MMTMLYEKALNKYGRHHEFRDEYGYIWVTAPSGHPRATKSVRGKYTGYVKRCVLVTELSLGRLLLAGEAVHHINGCKDDDRIENLSVMSLTEHSRLHQAQNNPRKRNGSPGIGEPCTRCSKALDTPKRGLCNACYMKAKKHKKKHGCWPVFALQFGE